MPKAMVLKKSPMERMLVSDHVDMHLGKTWSRMVAGVLLGDSKDIDSCGSLISDWSWGADSRSAMDYQYAVCVASMWDYAYQQQQFRNGQQTYQSRSLPDKYHIGED